METDGAVDWTKTIYTYIHTGAALTATPGYLTREEVLAKLCEDVARALATAERVQAAIDADDFEVEWRRGWRSLPPPEAEAAS